MIIRSFIRPVIRKNVSVKSQKHKLHISQSIKSNIYITVYIDYTFSNFIREDVKIIVFESGNLFGVIQVHVLLLVLNKTYTV